MHERPGHGGRPGPREGRARLPDGWTLCHAELGGAPAGEGHVAVLGNAAEVHGALRP
jgi:hypothetical protein